MFQRLAESQSRFLLLGDVPPVVTMTKNVPSYEKSTSRVYVGVSLQQGLLNSVEYQPLTDAELVPRLIIAACRRACPPIDVKVPTIASRVPAGFTAKRNTLVWPAFVPPGAPVMASLM